MAAQVPLKPVLHRTRRDSESVIVAHSEKDVFEILGLPYIHPTMRNADA